jgi:hypothetical protein
MEKLGTPQNLAEKRMEKLGTPQNLADEGMAQLVASNPNNCLETIFG